jgi:hypothetical protein
MLTSAVRRAANTANAQNSTGPRTPEGQARSSQNARTHGLTARDLIIAPDESEEFEQFLKDYQFDVKPQGAIQQGWFDLLVEAAWNLRRIRRMETKLCAGISVEDLLNDDEVQKKLDRIARHKVCIERTFHRSLKELKALQTNVFIQSTLPYSVRQNIPPLCNAIEISKRTQQVKATDEVRMLKEMLDAVTLPPSAAKARQAAGLSTP